MADKTGLILGGTRGAGLALARSLGTAGARLVLTDPEEDTAVAIALSLGQSGLGCDPDSAAAMDHLASRIDPDLIVLALDGTDQSEAGLPGIGQMSLSHLARAFGPGLCSRQGSLLVLATLPARRDPWITAAAGWITGATRGLAADWAPEGARVNAVIALRDEAPALPRFMAGAARTAPVPLGRLPQIAEIAAAAQFFCQEGATTGQVLHLDGGRGA